MAQAQPKPWTLDDFLTFDDGTDTRYELYRGEVVAMDPPSPSHGTIVANLIIQIGTRLVRPCRVITEAGVVPVDRSDTYFQADLLVTCSPPDPGLPHPPSPKLIVEVLSPSTGKSDRSIKVDDYATIPSVEEIVLVDSEKRWIQHWRRQGDVWQVQSLIGDAALQLAIMSEPIGFDAIYEDSGV